MAKIKLYIFLSEAVLFLFIEDRYTALEQSFTEACMRKDSSVLYKVLFCLCEEFYHNKPNSATNA